MINESHMKDVEKYVTGEWKDSPLTGLIYTAKVLGAAMVEYTSNSQENYIVDLQKAVDILQNRVSDQMHKR